MELTLQQISAMLDDSYIYVDVRSEIAYQHGHIANAVHWNGILQSPSENPLQYHFS